jgi:outer membrane protein TolC
MRRILSASLFTIIFLGVSHFCFAQQVNNNADSNQIVKPNPPKPHTEFAKVAPINDESKEVLIKAKLVELAVNNPQIDVADAQIRIAEANLSKAKNSWLSSLSLSSNINEFVINDKKIDSVPVASYYPKYNLGLTVPFDIFSKTKQEKNIASQNIVAAKALKQDRIRIIKTQVLTLYENYKEKKELLRLEKVSTEGDNDSYVTAQKSYADGTIQLGEMNKAYQLYVSAQSKLVSSQHDFNVATIELEQMIGISIDDAIRDATALKPIDN